MHLPILQRRLCGLPAHPKGEGLCLTHYRYVTAKPKPREDDLSCELASPGNDYITQIDINHVLGKLFDALGANRLTPRRASSLAYIAFLLDQTQKGAKEEARLWKKDMRIYKRMLSLKYTEDHPNHPDYVPPPPPPHLTYPDPAANIVDAEPVYPDAGRACPDAGRIHPPASNTNVCATRHLSPLFPVDSGRLCT